MKLEKVLNKQGFDEVYKIYEKIVDNPKQMYEVNKKVMVEEILNKYNIENYLFDICTAGEIDFLKYFLKNKLTKKARKKYEWEINELSCKLIFNKYRSEIYEEQLDNVKKAIKLNKQKDIKSYKDNQIFIVGMVRMNGYMLIDALVSVLKSLKFNIDEISNLLSSSFVNYYCCTYKEYKSSDSDPKEYICYNDYYDYINDIAIMREKHAISGIASGSFEQLEEMFYYGIYVSNEKVKNLLKSVKNTRFEFTVLKELENVRVTGKHSMMSFILGEDICNQIDDALYEVPCAYLCGRSLKQVEEQKKKREVLKISFSKVKQNNAHIPRKGADQFYKLYLSLIDYTNQKYKINLSIGRISKQGDTDGYSLMDIDVYLWQHKEIIDEYISVNPLKLRSDELEIVNGFKNAITSDEFIIVGYERDYTKILLNDKIYMVNGIRDNFDKLFGNRELPINISTTLLMFKDKIIYNSFMSYKDMIYDDNMKLDIAYLCDNAVECYEI